MSDPRGEVLQRHHNDGQEDASEGRNSPPHDFVEIMLGTVASIVTLGGLDNERDFEDNRAYSKGHSNGSK